MRTMNLNKKNLKQIVVVLITEDFSPVNRFLGSTIPSFICQNPTSYRHRRRQVGCCVPPRRFALYRYRGAADLVLLDRSGLPLPLF